MQVIHERYKKNYLLNLTHIQKINPSLYSKLEYISGNCQLETAKDGSLALKKGGVYLESRYHPKRNSSRYLKVETEKYETIIFLGSGLGYHINDLLMGENKKPRVNCKYVLIEKDPEVYKAALHILEPELLSNISSLIGLDLKNLEESLDEEIGFLNFQKISIIRHQQSINLESLYYSRIEEALVKRFKSSIASRTTEGKTQGLWVRNIFKNLSHRDYRFHGTRGLLNLFEGPVILVSSGPFIEDIIEPLKSWSRKLPLFSLLPSVPYLLKNGINPDFIVTTDGSFWNRLRFIGGVNLPLLTTYSVDPSLVKNWPASIYFFSHGLLLEEKLPVIREWSLKVPMQGTSSLVMILLARLMGFKEIYLAGFDFAYRGMKDHHPGAGFDNLYLSIYFRLKNWNTLLFEKLKKEYLIKVMDLYGKSLYSSHKLMLYRNWLKGEVWGRDLFRLNNGACIENLNITPFEIMEKYPPGYKEVFFEKLKGVKDHIIPGNQVFRDFLALKSLLDELGDPCSGNSPIRFYQLLFGDYPGDREEKVLREEVIQVIDTFNNALKVKTLL